MGVSLFWALGLPSSASAEATRFYELEGFGHFLDGNPQSTAITEDGTIMLRPQVKQRFADSATTFSAACGMGDAVVVARTEDAQVLRIDAAGKQRPLFKATEPLVTALWAVGQTLFVATAPGGRVYRITPKGAASLYYQAPAKFVWQMTNGPDDSLLMVTGEPGTLQRVDAKGGGETLFAPEQAHLRSVAFAPHLGTFVGGGERGVLYHAAKDQRFVALLDSGSPEITAIALGEQAAYVAAVSGAAALVGEDGKAPASKAGEVRSQVLRVGMDGSTDTLAGSTDEAVFTLALDNQGQLLVGTGASGRDDPRGRIYRIDPQHRQIALLLQSDSRRITHLVHLTHGHLAAVAGGGGSVTELTAQLAESGVFLTQPFDAALPATFGSLQVLGQFPGGSKTTVRLRTGQTAVPDATWSAWSEAVAAPGLRAVPALHGRFLQACITLQRFSHVSPQVQRLRVAYRRQNMAPFVHDVTALRKNLVLRSMPRDDGRTKVVMLSDKADGDDDAGRRTPVRVRQSEDPGSRTIKWLGDDPNGDELLYSLSVRSLEDATWRELAHDLREPFFTLSPGQLADGYYLFRVFASDAPSNAQGLERHDSRDSRAVLIDNTPPQITDLDVKLWHGKARLRGRVADASGALTVLSYALDAAAPRDMLPEDQVLDGPSESIDLDLGTLRKGRHVITVRARDDADNEAVAEVNFTTH